MVVRRHSISTRPAIKLIALPFFASPGTIGCSDARPAPLDLLLMSGLFAGTSLERPVTCAVCEQTLDACDCPRSADGTVCRPQDQAVRVTKEKRSKGKLVTVVHGLDPVATDLKALLKTLRSACGAGGTVTDDGVEVQGNHVDTVTAALRDRGYPVR